jgi:hypothetical protein
MSELDVIREAEERGRTDLWPFWRRAYADGNPLPALTCQVSRPHHRFDEGDPLPEEYRGLLLKMLRHEGERAGNKSFLGFMATCLDLAEALFPTQEMKLLKAEYLAEELKHAIMFHRLAVGLQHDFALRDVPYAHYAFHLPRETWADDAFFHFLVDLNGAFHARDWRESSYVPLAKMSATVERDAARAFRDGLLLPHSDLRREEGEGARAAPARQVVSGRARHVRPLGFAQRPEVHPVGPEERGQRRDPPALQSVRRPQAARARPRAAGRATPSSLPLIGRVDFRHFELSDLLSEALIAVEAGDRARAETALRRALRWVEADWLATPSDAPASTAPTAPADDNDDED